MLLPVHCLPKRGIIKLSVTYRGENCKCFMYGLAVICNIKKIHETFILLPPLYAFIQSLIISLSGKNTYRISNNILLHNNWKDLCWSVSIVSKHTRIFFVKNNPLIYTYLKLYITLFLWLTKPLVWNHKECVIRGSQINMIFRWQSLSSWM